MSATTCPTCGASFAEGAPICSICGTSAVPAGAGVGASVPSRETSDRIGDPSGSTAPDDTRAALPSGAGWSDPNATGPGAGAGSTPPPPPTGSRYVAPGVTSEQRGWAIGAHLGGLGMAFASAAVLGFVAPLVVWLLRKDEDPYAEHHAKEALNFQLTVLVAIVAATALAIPAVIIGVLTLGVGLVLGAVAIAAATVAWFVLPIIATVKASNGEGYRYPFTIRFVR